MASDLFQTAKIDRAILVVDCSGSTLGTSGVDAAPGVPMRIFDREMKICSELSYKGFNIVFWCSPMKNIQRFKNGTFVLPFNVKPEALQSAFAAAGSSIEGNCLTFPHLGFNAIPPEWMRTGADVIYITDGEIGYGGISAHNLNNLKINLVRSLHNVATAGNRLFIITVEKTVRDFNVAELKGAGSDVWKLLQDNNLTGIVTKFTSYNPNGSFVQINKNKAPSGFVPYEDKYFSEVRVSDFIRFIANELKEHPEENDQVRIAQNLSTTLEKLTRDKPPRVASSIIRSFSQMFVLDNNMVNFLLTEGIQNERGGAAATYGAYRAQLKNLFAEVDRLLKKNVAETIGLGDEFVSFMTCIRSANYNIDVGLIQPDGSILYHLPKARILTGMAYLVDKQMVIHGTKYPRAAFGCVPVFPMLNDRTYLTDINRQAIRQWTRAVFASMYNVHFTADEIIYLVLGTVLIVIKSNVPENVKSSYRCLGDIMLEKKRLNSQETERKRLDDGELPIPNSGIFADFTKYMITVADKLKIQASPMKLWHEMCLALDPALGAKQERHCREELNSHFSIPTVEHDAMPEGAAYDYQCLITLEDISATGGFRFVPHTNAAGNRCAPVYLLSIEGKNRMMLGDEHTRLCPVCYEQMTDASFAPIGAKTEFELPDEYKLSSRYFGSQDIPAKQSNEVFHRSQQKASGNVQQSVSITTGTGAFVKVVFLMGVVGSGKSTWAAECKRHIETRGGVCIIEGTDKYCKDGMHPRDAQARVTAELQKVSEIKNDDVVVIIDTCGDSTRNKRVEAFNVKFNGTRFDVWPNLDKNNIRGYLAWSLRNVLQRGACTSDSNFYLCPASAGMQVCIDVHKKKAKALLRQDEFKNWQFAGATIENLRELAEEYSKSLKQFEMPAGL